jgi:hypothetical protein
MTLNTFYKRLAEYWDAPNDNHMQEFQPEADCMDGVIGGVRKAWMASMEYCEAQNMTPEEADDFTDALILKVLHNGEF